MNAANWRIHHPSGRRRVVVTQDLPGRRWLDILEKADCRVEICTADPVLRPEALETAIGCRCDGAIGQLAEIWDEHLFSRLRAAGGRVYSNYAVGYNNVDVAAATRCGIAVGNTPGVLTETTAEMAVALTFAAARRIGEAERYVRAGRFKNWLPSLFLGRLLYRKTLGVIGAGRIGSAYARMMVEGHKMNLLYYSPRRNRNLEADISAYSDFLESRGQAPVTCCRTESIEELLRAADCVSVHTVLNPATRHLIDAPRLALMKADAVFVNTSRGPVLDETALVDHCRRHPGFRAGLDVYENEPALAPGLSELENVVLAPHIGSATRWTRESMAVLAAANVAGILQTGDIWQDADLSVFLSSDIPSAAPSILNARELKQKGGKP